MNYKWKLLDTHTATICHTHTHTQWNNGPHLTNGPPEYEARVEQLDFWKTEGLVFVYYGMSGQSERGTTKRWAVSRPSVHRSRRSNEEATREGESQLFVFVYYFIFLIVFLTKLYWHGFFLEPKLANKYNEMLKRTIEIFKTQYSSTEMHTRPEGGGGPRVRAAFFLLLPRGSRPLNERNFFFSFFFLERGRRPRDPFRRRGSNGWNASREMEICFVWLLIHQVGNQNSNFTLVNTQKKFET